MTVIDDHQAGSICTEPGQAKREVAGVLRRLCQPQLGLQHRSELVDVSERTHVDTKDRLKTEDDMLAHNPAKTGTCGSYGERGTPIANCLTQIRDRGVSELSHR